MAMNDKIANIEKKIARIRKQIESAKTAAERKRLNAQLVEFICKQRPVKGQYVRDSHNRRWTVIRVDVQDEGFFAERGRSTRFVSWELFEKYWRLE
ncbi:MAG TPA: hypothetical protein VN577_09965 [Terriglobales bacterium]|nr:hypothetical protein [Terriglobales bacterium]